jgi:Flp pilus assembly protein TadG
MISLFNRLRKRMSREDGTASMEFVLMVPVFLTVFMASFESGFLMVRQILLDRSVDQSMRELRLGHMAVVNQDTLRTQICSLTIVFSNCEANMLIELERVSTTTWSMPTTPTSCINRDEDISPAVILQIGQQNDVMLVRVCVIQDALFPTTGIGLDLAVDSAGGYALVSRSAFVVEPT